MQWGVAFGKGTPTRVFCGPWAPTLDRQGEGALGGDEQREMGRGA